MRLGCCGGAFVATWRAASRLGMTQRVSGDAQRDALERDAARHVATKTVGSTVDWRNAGLAWYAHGDGGGWAGESSRCEDPAPTVGVCGDSVATHCHRPTFATTWASTGPAKGRVTTRRAASLRPPRTGRIGFKPPYSKRDRGERPGGGQAFMERAFPPPCNEERFNQALAIIRRP